jgi:hypothetical protein
MANPKEDSYPRDPGEHLPGHRHDVAFGDTSVAFTATGVAFEET